MTKVSETLTLYRDHVINCTQYPLERSPGNSLIENLRGEHNIRGKRKIYNKKTGLFVITFDPTKKNYKVLFARKCRAGERAEVGHRNRQGRPGVGAAGTHEHYWGKWVSIGGTNGGNATSQLHAANLEYEDETAVNRRGNARRYLTYLHGKDTPSAYIYIAYIPYSCSEGLINKKKKELIFSSHGEIAELAWRPFTLNPYDYDNRVADYVKNSYKKILVPYIFNLPNYNIPGPGQQVPLHSQCLIQLIKKCNQ